MRGCGLSGSQDVAAFSGSVLTGDSSGRSFLENPQMIYFAESVDERGLWSSPRLSPSYKAPDWHSKSR